MLDAVLAWFWVLVLVHVGLTIIGVGLGLWAERSTLGQRTRDPGRPGAGGAATARSFSPT